MLNEYYNFKFENEEISIENKPMKGSCLYCIASFNIKEKDGFISKGSNSAYDARYKSLKRFIKGLKIYRELDISKEPIYKEIEKYL